MLLKKASERYQNLSEETKKSDKMEVNKMLTTKVG